MKEKYGVAYQLIFGTFVLFLCTFSIVDCVQAHSTKGRMKAPLDLAKPTVNDFAYFMESFIHNELYRHRVEKWERRFYVREFKNVTFSKDRKKAEVFFVRLDTKDNSFLDQSMIFHRGENNIWFFTDDKGKKIEVYCYFTKLRYYKYHYPKFIIPVSCVVIVLLSIMLVLMIRKRRENDTVSLDYYESSYHDMESSEENTV